MSRKLIFVCQICEKILTRNVGFWEEEKLGYLKKKKKTLPLKRVTFKIWTPAVTSNVSQTEFVAEHVK